MKPPRFAIGQPVLVRFCRSVYNVIAIEPLSTTYRYTLQLHTGETITEIDEMLERMLPFPKEKKRNGKIRTKWGYFFTIRGGLYNEQRIAV